MNLLRAKKRNKIFTGITGIALLFVLCIHVSPVKAQKRSGGDIYSRNNLVAWCIVPFDSKNRGPEERAQMLKKLGITKLAYDWREKHIPSFDEELDMLKKYNIKLEGFWFASGPHPEDDKNLQIIIDLLKRHGVKTQLWCMFGGIPAFDNMTQEEKVRAMAKPVAYIAKKLDEIGCKLGLYNHGGWFGEPENQLAVIDYLKMPNIGIVYNLHHAEGDLNSFPVFFPKILPHLLAFNIAGLIKGDPVKVVPVGQGDAEAAIMRMVWKSSYRGPVGIINESFAPDAEVGLQLNIDGLKKVLAEIGDKAALKTYR
ncbi:TIM barrel protein [Chitinophaga sp. MM2321]|uniref:sugar phosphate isomerase/epimerase family protein n=1 Tax=Chitinophaga sp. MM2321 TaxID=3137178 RepID=UPI0032D56BBD